MESELGARLQGDPVDGADGGPTDPKVVLQTHTSRSHLQTARATGNARRKPQRLVLNEVFETGLVVLRVQYARTVVDEAGASGSEVGRRGTLRDSKGPQTLKTSMVSA